MTKQKMTAAEANELVHAAATAAEAVTALQAACSKMKIDDLPDPMRMAWSLIVAARDLNQTALTLFSRADLQKLQADNQAARAELQQLGNSKES